MINVIIERKGTEEKRIFEVVNENRASILINFLQENDNSNNEFLVYQEIC